MDPVRPLPGTSLHHQISTLIQDGIASGRWHPGDQLPTEDDLCRLHQVSRVTVRNALKSLQQQGLIERQAGRGTFVSRRLAIDRLATPIGPYLDQVAERRKAVRHVVKEFGPVPAPPGVAERFGIAPGEPVLRVVRLRLRDRLPIAHGTLWLPEPIGRRLTRADFRCHALSELLARQGHRYGRIEMVTRACLASPPVARLLKVPVGSALVDLNRVGHDTAGAVVEVQQLLGPPDRFHTRVTIDGDGDRDEAGAAGGRRRGSGIMRSRPAKEPSR